MYSFLWRVLPGGTAVRAGALTVLALATAAVLWFLAFPWAASHLPLDGTMFSG